MTFEIEKIHAREILDSRGNPTIEVDVWTEYGFGRAAIPSGASTGTHEAVELRDGGDRYDGKGVQKAMKNVNEVIAPELIGIDVCNQRGIDRLMIELDNTPNKANLGANAILGVSLGAAKAAADTLEVPLYRYLGGVNATQLPVPSLNVLNGGQHAGNDLAIQEFMILPKGADRFSEGLRMAAETYHALGRIYEEEIGIGMDAAATSFYSNGSYAIDGKNLSGGEMVDLYADLVETYPIVLIEDPFEEEAFEDFAALTARLRETIIVGDDIYVTNVERLAKGIEMKATNALLLKLNQIGTVSEAFDAARMAFRNGYKVMASHRSAETEDSALADVTVALGAEMLKTGAPARSERNAKYNQLLRIEEELGRAASYARI
jgi:enolase